MCLLQLPLPDPIDGEQRELAESISVQEFHEEDGLNAREILYLFKNSLDQTFVSTKSAEAFNCGFTPHSNPTKTAEAYVGGFAVNVDGYSWSSIFARSIVKDDKTFVVAYHVLSLSNDLSTEDSLYMVDSFTLLPNYDSLPETPKPA